MSMPQLENPLWVPRADARESTAIGRFQTHVEELTGEEFEDYDAFWQWSIDHLEEFWEYFWDFADVGASRRFDRVVSDGHMMDRHWFVGSRLNYAARALIGDGKGPALIGVSDSRATQTWSWDELRDQVARVRSGLKKAGVGRGDAVVAYLPNIPETMAAFLATASLGAVWATCAPEFGSRSALERFEPCNAKVLMVVDGYRYGNRDIDRTDAVAELRAGLSVQTTVWLPYREGQDRPEGVTTWSELTAEVGPLEFEQVPSDHPLYILFSSGTTGPPKPIIHTHGGVLLEHLKVGLLHADLRPEDRFFWYTTTGWMMWNFLAVGLLAGSTVLTFDGDPNAGAGTRLWSLAEEHAITWLGVGAPYLTGGWKSRLRPRAAFQIEGLRVLGVTGSPLPADVARWVFEEVGSDIHLSSMSGGTDVCTAFVGGSPLSPVWAGELSCRYLAVAAQAFDEAGNPIVGSPGELVITEPMPSMPLGFLGDEDRSRFRETYFERFPGVWAHGDWIRFTSQGSSMIVGRSDATLNRGGVRVGTAEYARVLDRSELISDHLIVHRDDLTGTTPGELWLFIVPADGISVSEQVSQELAALIRSELSPRHVPDVVRSVQQIPRTKTGKKLEIPIKRLLQGEHVKDVVKLDALAELSSLDDFLRIVEESRDR